MSKNKFFLLLVALILKSSPVCAVFGQGEVPLEDYYEFGKRQTGVAQVCTNTGLGTANLIDVGIESLKGRLMITCAHVINDVEANSCSIRFMDENNESTKVEAQNFFIPSQHKEDIGLILLKEAVDVEKFKPLKLNLSRSNEELRGKQVDVFGCSSLFGKANSNIALRERLALRRGMTTILSTCKNDYPIMSSPFYDYRGFSTIKCLSKNERELKIDEEIKSLRLLMKTATDRSEEIKFAFRIKDLNYELEDIHRQLVRLKTIYYDDHFEEQLQELASAGGLNKAEVMSRWKQLTDDESSISTTFELDDYHIQLYKPLPRLSGFVYSGDSGGAWVCDDEIVALTTLGPPNKNILIQPIDCSCENIPNYFSECEDKIIRLNSLNALTSFQELVTTVDTTSIWSCRGWIQATLKEIIS